MAADALLREAEEAQLRALSLPALRAELDGALHALSVLKAELGGRLSWP